MMKKIFERLRGWFRRKVVRDIPRLDMDRLNQIAQMIEFVDDFTEPSRSRFRAKYAQEFLFIVRGYLREVNEWEEGKDAASYQKFGDRGSGAHFA